EFEAGEGKGDLRPEIDGVPVPRRQHVADGEVRDGSVAPREECAERDEDGKRQEGADSACVLQPLADVEADDVQPDGDEEKAERDFDLERSILREDGAAGSA